MKRCYCCEGNNPEIKIFGLDIGYVTVGISIGNEYAYEDISGAVQF